MKLKQLFVSLSIGAALFGVSHLTSADEIITLGTKGGPSLLKEKRLPQSTAFIKNDKNILMGYGAEVCGGSIKSPLKILILSLLPTSQ
ncbi:hypothetical protein J4727_19475 [Providencia rettgeri]|uniref:Uncharacterized protein n=1 Tax=Providencia rettgeri TaxID=587 RepID=A0A939ND69_PRORE|nr:hypothetical protein [Providencia rettgeri]